MTPRTAKIQLNADGSGTVEVDGQLLRGVQSLRIDGELQCMPQVTLELQLYDVSTVAEAQILVPADTVETLVALGWTPPPEQEVDGGTP